MVIIGGGTGNPYLLPILQQLSDVQRLGAEALESYKVDGIYDSDPIKIRRLSDLNR